MGERAEAHGANGSTRSPLRRCPIVALSGLLTIGACHHVATPRLQHFDLTQGYRYDSLLPSTRGGRRNSDDISIVLAFSGGGTRAASLSYGVLAQLRATTIYWDSLKRAPCDPSADAHCRSQGRSLLDEVDVISSVSGGSFASAYYTLYGDSIFNPASTFQRGMLYHRVQSDLLSQALFTPSSWRHLFSRSEIAAEYHERRIFGKATFGQLVRGPRPYLILNATDASTGARFEFTQEQFDLLCADLSQVPVARGVAASSSFPVLLNSLTIDSHNAQGCGYQEPQWVANAVNDAFTNPTRHRAALTQRAYRDSSRRYLHLLDGGLADNLGARAVTQSLAYPDVATQLRKDGSRVAAGWNLRRLIASKKVKTVVVIVVDARTKQKKDWDRKASGPWTVPVVDAAAGIPMGNFTTETIEVLRASVLDASPSDSDTVRFYAMPVSLDDVADPSERAFLRGRGTNFELSRFEVDCLASRSAALLRNGRFYASMSADTAGRGVTFDSLVTAYFHGTVSRAELQHPPLCTESAQQATRSVTRHTVDVVLQRNATSHVSTGLQDDVGASLGLRIAKPRGLGATLGVIRENFGVAKVEGGDSLAHGRVRLSGASIGAILTDHYGPLEVGVGLSVGAARLASRVAMQGIDAPGGTGHASRRVAATLLARPYVSATYSLTNSIAVVSTVSRLWTPNLVLRDARDREPLRVRVDAVRLSVGLGYRIF